MSKKKTKIEFANEVKDIFNGNIEVIGDYVNNKEKILVKFINCGHEEYKIPTKLLAGHGCSKCKGKRISQSKTCSKQKFIEKLSKNGIDYIDFTGEYNGTKKKIKVVNKNCGHKYEAVASNILQGSGCPICHGMKDTEKFIEQINQKYPNEYVIIGEYVNNRVPIKVKHKCGYEWSVIPKDLMRDIRCPKCIMSKGELFISNYLEVHNINYVPQYKFKDCKDKLSLPFDFMVEVDGEKRLIEFDGSQHYGDTRSIFRIENIKLHDAIKDKFCNENKIKLLRIPYWWIRNERIIKELDKFILNK